MGEVHTLEHVAVIVTDLERSKHFYHDLLGLDVIQYVFHDGGPVGDLFATGPTHLKEYRLRPPKGPGPATGPGFTIDLIQFATPKGEIRAPAINEVPTAHFAFGVPDIAAAYERLKAAGVAFVSPPVVFPEEEGGWRVVFARDPDGFLVELTEMRQ